MKNKIKKKYIIIGIIVIIIGLFLRWELSSYEKGIKLYNNNQYSAAVSKFKLIKYYRKSGKYLSKCYYSIAEEMFNDDNSNYIAALDLLEKSPELNKTTWLYESCITSYIQDHLVVTDDRTNEYLKILVENNSANADKLCMQLYPWKINVFAINTSETDTTTNLSKINCGEYIYFHYEAISGEIDSTLKIKTITYHPSTSSPKTYNFKDSMTTAGTGWYGIDSGYKPGMLKVEFYDQFDDLIGECSVELINKE